MLLLAIDSSNTGQNKNSYYHTNIVEMESNNELKEIDIQNHVCYYFEDIINVNDLHLDNILWDEKSYDNFNFNWWSCI